MSAEHPAAKTFGSRDITEARGVAAKLEAEGNFYSAGVVLDLIAKLEALGPVKQYAKVPEFVTLADVAEIIRAAAKGAERKGGLTECSAAALNSWAEVLERNLEAAHA